MARLWRVHHPLDNPGPGEEIRLSADESHHVRRVLRLSAGDRLAVFDGRGEEWEGTLLDDPAAAAIRLERRTDEPVEAPLSVALFQAVSKVERLEQVVQKACEIGVGAVHPLRADRGGVASASERRDRRLRKIALAACKQSGRRVLPALEPVDSLPAADDPSVLALLLDPSPSARPIGSVLADAVPSTVWIAVGPEGGFDRREVDRATGSGWIPVGLGPRTLRTETAGIVAAAIVLHRLGDLGAG